MACFMLMVAATGYASTSDRDQTVRAQTSSKPILYRVIDHANHAVATMAPATTTTVPPTTTTVPPTTTTTEPPPPPTTVAPAPPPAPKAAVARTSGGPTDEQLRQLRQCESGGNYQSNTGNGYYGAYQFSAGTWRSMGTGIDRADHAAPAVQDDAARRLIIRSGWGQFPACSRKIGMR